MGVWVAGHAPRRPQFLGKHQAKELKNGNKDSHGREIWKNLWRLFVYRLQHVHIKAAELHRVKLRQESSWRPPCKLRRRHFVPVVFLSVVLLDLTEIVWCRASISVVRL